MNDLQERLDRAGVLEYGIVDPRDVEFREDVRAMCAENKCRKYGTSWACPPAIGTVDECRARAQSFDKMLVFSRKFDLEDSYDIEGMQDAMKGFKSVARDIDDELRPLLKDCLVLGNEGCGRCDSCTYPDAPCRFRDKVHGSIEGYGILVSDLAKLAGIKYYNGKDTVTFFGAVLYNGETPAAE